VVTKQNRQPYIGTVVIANPDGPYILLNQFQANEISGNNNGKLESGEIISLDVELKNYGNSDGEGVLAALSTNDPYLTISDADEDYGTVPAQSTLAKDSAFSFIIGDNIPDGHVVEFSMDVQDQARETWNSQFTIQLSAPVLTIDKLKVNDTDSGNGNGRLDPGENAKIIVTCANMGHSIAHNATLRLEARSGFVQITDPNYVIGELGLFGNTQVSFDVTVSADAPEGIISDFISTLAADNGFELVNVCPLKIGLVNEDFETGNFNSFPWTMGGDKPWVTTTSYPFEGYFSIRSGSITHNQSSEIELTYHVLTPDSISFYRKVSSESGDKLKFFINDILMAEWSGTAQGWRREAFAVGAGVKTFRWAYVKDGSNTIGADCGWLDYIVFPPPVVTTNYAGPDAEICGGNTAQLNGDATNAASVEWTTSGTGTFNNNTILGPVYTPSEADIANGLVTLTFDVTGLDEIVVSDEMILSFVQAAAQPSIPSGPESIDLLSTMISDYTTQSVEGANSYSWSVIPPEAGIILSRGITGTIVWDRDYAGEASIQVAAVNTCGGGPVSEPLVVTIENSGVGISDPGPGNWQLEVYPNPADRLLNVQLGGTSGVTLRIRLVDLMGKTVFMTQHKILDNGTIITMGRQNLCPGLYLLVAEDGKNSVCKKIVLK
jgi:hypothetical protein